MQTTLDLQNTKKTEIQYHQVSTLFFKLGKLNFPTLRKMGYMKKLWECANFGLIEIVRHKVTSFVSQKYDTEDDILVCIYCKITQEISISSVYFKQKMGLFKKTL